MGCCSSNLTPEEREAIRRSKELATANLDSFNNESKKVKLLLLGTGASGKSTIFKQIKILYGVISDKERIYYTTVVHTNAVEGMKTLLAKCEALGFADQLSKEGKEAAQVVAASTLGVEVDVRLGTAIKILWAEEAIQTTFKKRSSFQLSDSVSYIFNEIDRIMEEGYLASVTDILHARVRTSGIVTERYKINETLFELYDVGGQRNERRKWIHCFDNVSAVIFVVALSEYDMLLYEDQETNRMVEAIQLFRDICNNQAFISSSMILFFNKKDLYYKKVAKTNIASVPEFADYDGPECDPDAGMEYFLKKFLLANENPSRRIYHHATCATDTENVNHVFNICVDMIFRSSLNDSGFMV